MDELLTAVSTVGFPIVSFFAMYYMCTKQIEKSTEALNKLENAIIELSTSLKREV